MYPQAYVVVTVTLRSLCPPSLALHVLAAIVRTCAVGQGLTVMSACSCGVGLPRCFSASRHTVWYVLVPWLSRS